MITEFFFMIIILRLLVGEAACLYSAAHGPQPHGCCLDLWPAKDRPPIKCQQTIKHS